MICRLILLNYWLLVGDCASAEERRSSISLSGVGPVFGGTGLTVDVPEYEGLTRILKYSDNWIRKILKT